jgi:FixJ family two-component response regulator
MLEKVRDAVGANVPASPGTPIVFVVDDDVSVRQSVELLIRCEGWEPLLFASASEFLAHPDVSVPHCLLLDVALPDLTGLELQRLVASERASMPIIFISGRGDVPTTVQAMKMGAVEFLTKPLSPDALVSAIHDAMGRSRMALGHEAELQMLRRRHDSLSQRERDVLKLVVTGLLNKQVGAELGISEVTVKVHRGKVMRKMNASSLADLVRMAGRLGITARAPGRG